MKNNIETIYCNLENTIDYIEDTMKNLVELSDMLIKNDMTDEFIIIAEAMGKIARSHNLVLSVYKKI